MDKKVMKRSRMGATEARPGYTLETAAITAGSALATIAPPTGTCNHRQSSRHTHGVGVIRNVHGTSRVVERGPTSAGDVSAARTYSYGDGNSKTLSLATPPRPMRCIE